MRKTPWPALSALQDPEILAGAQDTRANLEDRILDLEADGIGLAAPRTVDMAAGKAVPFTYCTSEDALRDWAVPTKKNLALLVEALDFPWYNAVKLYRDTKPKVKGSGAPPPKPSGDAAEARTCGCRFLDARSEAGIPFRPGRYALTLFNRDWKSNTEVVDLVDRAAAPPQGNPPGLSASWLESLMKSRASGWSALPVTDADKGLGLRFPAPIGRPEDPVWAEGTSRIILGSHHLLSAEQKSSLPWEAGQAVVIAVPVLMLFAVQNLREPFCLQAILPLTLDVLPAIGEEIAFSFRINLGEGADWIRSARRFWAYLAAGDAVIGPVVLENDDES